MKKKSKQKPLRRRDENRVRQIIEHYESQTEDEQYTEIEAALKAENITMMAVPTELVPRVGALIARERSA